MLPKEFLTRFAADVVKRSGICQATVEAVLPAVFDEIRYRLVEGKYPCVPIDSFGTFAVVNIPERKYHYTYKGADEMRTLPPQKRLKFVMTNNMKRELQAGKFDETRKSFKRHLQDPAIRKRKDMRYRPCKNGVFKGATMPVNANDHTPDPSHEG